MVYLWYTKRQHLVVNVDTIIFIYQPNENIMIVSTFIAVHIFMIRTFWGIPIPTEIIFDGT